MRATLSCNLQRVVARNLPGLKFTDLSEDIGIGSSNISIGTIRRNSGGSIRSQLVCIDVPKIVQVNTLGSDIGKLEYG